MTKDAKKLLDEALNLPTSDRAVLAASLFDSLDPGEDTMVEAAWEVEIARRVEELNSGLVASIPWAEARKKILEKL